MLNTCKIDGLRSQNNGPYATVDEAIEALTTTNLHWLAQVAQQRLRSLRNHPGLARYLAGTDPDEIVDEAIARLQCGSRKTKHGHLQCRDSFLRHVASVINSVVNNFPRHVEPHIEHVPLMDGTCDPIAAEDVRRDVAEREWLGWLFSVLKHSASVELRQELFRLRKTLAAGSPADHLVQQCSEGMLDELREQVTANGMDGPELRPSLN